MFYLANLIESQGRGVEKICQVCKFSSAPLPEYTVHPDNVLIKFTAANRIISAMLMHGKEAGTKSKR